MLPLLPVAEQQQVLEAGASANRIEKAGVGDDGSVPFEVGAPPRKRKPSAQDVNQGDWIPYAPALTPQLRALLQSQIKNPPPNVVRSQIRRLQPRIEELNSWERPMPRCRVKNQTKQWYADTLDKVQPPLPSLEWHRLRDLARGVKSEPVVLRRKALHTSTRDPLEMIAVGGQPSGRTLLQHRSAHTVTSRYMRRLWSLVFSQCPLMEWNAEKADWKVFWGQDELQGLQRHPPQDATSQPQQLMGGD